jgi:hypothetical protein
MKTYVNKNNSEWKAYQRRDGNYNCKIDNKSYHTVKLKEQIEGSSDWVLFTDWYRYKISEDLDKELSQLDDLVWDNHPQKDNTMKETKEGFTVLEYKIKGDSEIYKISDLTCKLSSVDFSKDLEIIKVRRESDGEVFSVGDKIGDNEVICTIEEFYISDMFHFGLGVCLSDGKSDISLRAVKKAYPVADGCVCEGDIVYYVSDSVGTIPFTFSKRAAVNLFNVFKTPPQPKEKEQKPQEILSVRVGDKKYKLGQEYKGGKIKSFFTNNGDIWLSLNCGDQYKL